MVLVILANGTLHWYWHYWLGNTGGIILVLAILAEYQVMAEVSPAHRSHARVSKVDVSFPSNCSNYPFPSLVLGSC